MARKGGGARTAGVLLAVLAGAFVIVAFRGREPTDGEPPPPDNGDNGGNGDGPLAFEPILLGEPTVQVNPF